MASLADYAEEMALKAEGNWHKFDSFGWHEQPEDAERFTIVYTSNRDSGLLEQSNAAIIEREMAPFREGDDPDCYSESHNHWACGHVDGFAIRVRRDDGSLTPAWLKYCELMSALEDYPCLDEGDYSDRQYEATVKAIRLEGRSIVKDDAPQDWESEVWSWLSENEPNELEDDGQDQGPYPSKESVREALKSLGYLDE